MTSLRASIAALLGAARGVASVVGVLVVAGVMVWLLAGRESPGTGATTSEPPVVAAASREPSSTTQAPPTPVLEATPVGPSSGPTGASEATPSTQTSEPTPEPTPRATATHVPATPKPTTKPTARPTHDPAPEPTPRLGTASGSFGQTLSIDGLQARMDRRDASQDPTIRCGLTDDPEMQGFTDVVTYALRITWPDPADASEPWIAVGATPFNVLWFDPQVASGVDVLFSTCKRPADSDKALVEVTPNDSMSTTFRFTFR